MSDRVPCPPYCGSAARGFGGRARLSHILEDGSVYRQVWWAYSPNHISKTVLSIVKKGPPNWTKSRTFGLRYPVGTPKTAPGHAYEFRILGMSETNRFKTTIGPCVSLPLAGVPSPMIWRDIWSA